MRNLLITTIGKYNHLNQWISGECNFDTAIINYDNHEEPHKAKCIYYGIMDTFKYPGIYKMFEDEPSLLNYDYFWMPDEDVALSTDDINMLFWKMELYLLSLAQPSIEKSAISFPSWECFTHRGDSSLIYANFVEITCPCFSKIGLLKCLHAFNKSQSGWGLDLVWSKLISDSGCNIGILNDIIAQHTRQVGGGYLYSSLLKKKIRPSTERKRLMAEYGIPEIDIKIYG
jgi:hypothetical protein